MVERPKSSVALVVILLVLVVVAALYGVGYFTLASSGVMKLPIGPVNRTTGFLTDVTVCHERMYPHPAIARLYYPADYLKARCEQLPVSVYGDLRREAVLYSIRP